MKQPASLTVVVPTYNRAELLQRCVGSVLEDVGDEHVSGRLRVVLADDCSTSPAAVSALRGLEADFPAEVLKVVRLPRNTGGASTPRNTGLDHVVSTHVFFVDSDDYLGVGAIPRLLRILDDHPDLDYLAVNTVSSDDRARELSVEDDFAEVGFEQAATSLTSKRIYRTELLSALGLRFDERMTVFEDFLFTFSFLAHAGRTGLAGSHDYYHFSGHKDFDSAQEEGHLSRRDHTSGYFAHHRVADMLRFFEGSLLELAASGVAEEVRVRVAVDVLLPRLFKVMAFSRTLGFVSNKARQRGLFRRARNVLMSPLFTTEYVLASLDSTYSKHIEAILADDLERLLAV